MPRQYEDTELAWAAGFFDGEGTTCATTSGSVNKKARNLVMAVAQAREYAIPLLERFQKAVGFGKIYKMGSKPRGNRSQCYQWRVTKFSEIQTILKLLWLYLGPAKREQAESQVLEYLNFPRMKMNSERGKAMAERRWKNSSTVYGDARCIQETRLK